MRDLEQTLLKASQRHADHSQAPRNLIALAASDGSQLLALMLPVERAAARELNSDSGGDNQHVAPFFVCFSSRQAVTEFVESGHVDIDESAIDSVLEVSLRQIAQTAVAHNAGVLFVDSIDSVTVIHGSSPGLGNAFKIRWRYVGLLVGCLLEIFTNPEPLPHDGRPFRLFAYCGAGLALGEVAERLWTGQLHTSSWRFSLRTLLFLTIIGPLVLALVYFQWQGSQENLPPPIRANKSSPAHNFLNSR